MNGSKIVTEWIEKAEGDYRTAEREVRVTQSPNAVRAFVRQKLGLE